MSLQNKSINSDNFNGGNCRNNNIREVKIMALSAAIWKTMERFGVAVITLLVQIILARLLTPNDFGLMAIVIVFVNLSQVLVLGGMNTALVRDQKADQADCSTVFWSTLIVAVVLYFLVFIFSPTIEIFFAMKGLSSVLRVQGVLLLICAYNSIQVALLQRDLRMKEQFVATSVAAILSGCGGVALALSGSGVWALVFQSLSLQIISCFIMAFQVKWRPHFLFCKKSFHRLFGFGWKLMTSSLIFTLHNSLYDLIIGKVFSANELGIFSQGRKYPQYVENILDVSLSQVTLPAAALLRDSSKNLKMLMIRAIQLSFTCIAPLMLALCVTARPLIVVVFGEQWEPSVLFFQMFCIAFTFTPIARINLQCLNAIGRSDVTLKLEVAGKVISLFLLAVACTQNKLLLVTIAYLCGYIIATILNMVPAKSLFEYGPIEQITECIPIVAIASLCAALASPLKLLTDNLLLLLVLQPSIVLVSFLLLSELFKPKAYLYTKSQFIMIINKVVAKNAANH